MLVKLAFVMQKLKKISKKVLVMIKNDGGGGEFLDFMGGHSCYEGDIELTEGSPPTGKNPGKV